MPQSGYSGTPLAKKLGLRDGMRACAIGCETDYLALVAPTPEEASRLGDLRLLARPGRDMDLVHLFTKRRAVLERRLPNLMDAIRSDGMIWISWPKKASKVPTDVTEDVVREVALPLGLVDVKVCAVDEVWSGLKLMIRRERRGRR